MCFSQPPLQVMIIVANHTWQFIWESVFADVCLGLASCEVTLLLFTQILQYLTVKILFKHGMKGVWY